jgi:hypothetical protein
MLILSSGQGLLPDELPLSDPHPFQPGDTKQWASSMVRRAAFNFTMLAAFVPCYLYTKESRHIHDWLPSLSTEATRFLYSYDLSCVEELKVWPPPSSGGGLAASQWPWLLSAGFRSGGPEIHLAIASLLLRHGDGIPRPLSVIREQTYQLSPTSFFVLQGFSRMAHYYCPVPKRRKHLMLDPSFPSEARGCGFTTFSTLARLASSEVFRVITISRTYSWEVLARCGPPPVPVDSPLPPSPPPVVPPGWGDADWNWRPPSLARIDFSMTPVSEPDPPLHAGLSGRGYLLLPPAWHCS